MRGSRDGMEGTRPFTTTTIPLDVVGDTVLPYPGTFFMLDYLLSSGNVDVSFNVKSAGEPIQMRAYPGISAKIPTGFDCVKISNYAAQAGKVATIIIGVDGAEIVK